MKKIILFTLVFLLIATGDTFAVINGQQGGVHESGIGLVVEEVEGVQIEVKGSQQGNGVQVQIKNEGTGQELQVNQGEGNGNGQQVQQQTQNTGEEQMLQVQNQEQVEQGLNTEIKEEKANQNRTRGSIQNILTTTEYLNSETGEEIAEITEEISSAIEQIYIAEDKIANRGRIIRFLAGGDKASAEKIKNLSQSNEQKLFQLQNTINNCDCDLGAKETLQAQVQLIEQDQIRLQEIAREELNSNGIFGWIVKLFK